MPQMPRRDEMAVSAASQWAPLLKSGAQFAGSRELYGAGAALPGIVGVNQAYEAVYGSSATSGLEGDQRKFDGVGLAVGALNTLSHAVHGAGSARAVPGYLDGTALVLIAAGTAVRPAVPGTGARTSGPSVYRRTLSAVVHQLTPLVKAAGRYAGSPTVYGVGAGLPGVDGLTQMYDALRDMYKPDHDQREGAAKFDAARLVNGMCNATGHALYGAGSAGALPSYATGTGLLLVGASAFVKQRWLGTREARGATLPRFAENVVRASHESTRGRVPQRARLSVAQAAALNAQPPRRRADSAPERGRPPVAESSPARRRAVSAPPTVPVRRSPQGVHAL